ncbi:hypothetical protein [Hyunsoonleella ulvae]|uniref:hypothetical protein n=1 Tax=Hyunsoonleella ulvae TaxID=2799948 RepID=UPI001939617F|nr:hypothetical protein [Hyunsoonleella ulvae]
MSKSIKEYYESLIKELEVEATVKILDDEITEKIFNGIDEDLEEFKVENQKRVKETLEKISNVVFTS